MSNEEIQEIVAKAENFHEWLKDKVHEQQEEINDLKQELNQWDEKYVELYDKHMKLRDEKKFLQEEINRLNNIINELEWKPIEQYEKPKYDWVLVKYFIEPNFECIPCVAENRFGKWYDRNNNLINGEVRYFFDMQQLDKLKELKEDNK